LNTFLKRCYTFVLLRCLRALAHMQSMCSNKHHGLSAPWHTSRSVPWQTLPSVCKHWKANIGVYLYYSNVGQVLLFVGREVYIPPPFTFPLVCQFIVRSAVLIHQMLDEAVLPASLAKKPVLPAALAGKPVLLASLVEQPVSPAAPAGQPILPASLVEQPVLAAALAGQPVLLGQPFLPASLVKQPVLPSALDGQPVLPVSLGIIPEAPAGLALLPAAPAGLPLLLEATGLLALSRRQQSPLHHLQLGSHQSSLYHRPFNHQSPLCCQQLRTGYCLCSSFLITLL
jgi:hypothetical protein